MVLTLRSKLLTNLVACLAAALASPALAALPMPGDVVLGLSVDDEAVEDMSMDDYVTLELIRGPASADGGVELASPYTLTPFVQSVEFDNYGGILHNANGNLLGLNFGESGVGGEIYSFATTGTDPAPAPQVLASFPAAEGFGDIGATRLANISVSPNNDKIALFGFDIGEVIVFDYTPGDTMGSGAALSNPRQTNAGSLFVDGVTQGVTWIDNNTIAAFSANFGDIFEVDATTMATTLQRLGPDEVNLNGSRFLSLTYNPEVSEYVYGVFSQFVSPDSITYIYVFDPNNGYSTVNTINLNGTSETGRELALDKDGNLFIGGFAGTIDIIPNIAADPASIGDDSSIDWYQTNDFGSFTGLDVGFGPDVVVVLGDSNGDGVVNTLDIDAFVLALTDPSGYASMFPDVDFLGANDIDGSGAVNTLDIDPFVTILTGAATAVPEPASAMLMALVAAAGLCGRARRA